VQPAAAQAQAVQPPPRQPAQQAARVVRAASVRVAIFNKPAAPVVRAAPAAIMMRLQPMAVAVAVVAVVVLTPEFWAHTMEARPWLPPTMAQRAAVVPGRVAKVAIGAAVVAQQEMRAALMAGFRCLVRVAQQPALPIPRR
jgi:homoserine kinase